MINVFQPTVGEEELAAVAQVFRSNWVGKGARTAEFEAEFASHLGVGRDRVTSTSCCTEALFLAARLVGLGPGDDVVLPTVSFVGAGNAVAAHGARPVFCDVDPRTLNPTVDDVLAALTPKTKAVIVLHYGGYPGAVAEIAALCRDRGIMLIEDAACSVASKVDYKACGVIGDIGVWSFSGPKVLVTGDGGMLSARDPELVEKAGKLAYLGLEQFSGFSQAKRADTRWWDFQISSFASRSIMNDIQAAIGLVQLGKLKSFVERRREIVAHYDEALADVGGLVLPPPLPHGHTSSYYLYWVQMDENIRDDVARDLYEMGIYTTFRYAALHQVHAYGSSAQLPNAEAAVAQTLCLPLHQGLSDGDVDKTVTALRDAMTRRVRATRSAAGGAR
jgi:aminotransferase